MNYLKISNILISILLLLAGASIFIHVLNEYNGGIVNLIFGNFNKILFGIISIHLGSFLFELEIRE